MSAVSVLRIFSLALGFLFLLSLVPLVSAATCAERSYFASCSKCSFDSTGKMDSACYERYQGSGTACLFAAYPVESVQYKMGSCPAIDVCIEQLNDCKSLYTTGSDRMDCEADQINHCFVRGDACVARAVKDCNGNPSDALANEAPPSSWCDGFFFFVLPVFFGVVFYRRS